jgi:hypothetical protein
VRAALDQTDLQGANLTGANLAGATWTDVTCPDGTNSDASSPQVCAAHLAPPVAKPAVVSGTSGTHGWYVSPVTVGWNWTDSDGTIPATCPAASTTSGNGTINLNVSWTDSNGTVGSATATVRVDTTRPVVTLAGPRDAAIYTAGHVALTSSARRLCRTVTSRPPEGQVRGSPARCFASPCTDLHGFLIAPHRLTFWLTSR